LRAALSPIATVEAAPVVILNAGAAQDLFGGEAAAIGRRVRLNREAWREVVGVVGGVRSTFFNTLEWRSDPMVYRPAAQAFSTLSNPAATSFGFNVHIRSDRVPSAGEVREAIRSASPRAIFTGLRPASELVEEATRQPAFRMTLLSWFAAVSLLLGAMGVYGLVSQAVNQRAREVAIRIALGARPSAVMAMITRRALTMAAAGLGIGAVGAYLLGNSLRAVLYGVQPRDAMSFLTATGLFAAVTTLAAVIPSFRVAQVDPVKVLRTE
jgi:hypothetical protein